MNTINKSTWYAWLARSNGVLFFAAIISYTTFFYYFVYGTSTVTMYDAGHYHAATLNLLNTGSYVNADGSPLFYRLPAYPVFLSFFYSFVGNNVWAALLLQVLLMATMPLLVRRCIFSFTRDVNLACIASWLSVVAPGYLIFSGLLLTDMLFAWVFLPFLLVLLRFIDTNGSLSHAATAGFLLGILSLIRPVGHLLLPFLGLYIFCFLHASLIRKVCVFLAMSCCWLTLVGWWLLRNFMFTGLLFFHTLPGPHFVNHLAVRLVSTAQGLTHEQAKDAVYKKLDAQILLQEAEQGRPLNEIERCNVLKKFAVDTIKLYPIEFLKLSIINCFKTTAALYSSELLVIDSAGELPLYDQQSFFSRAQRFLFPCVHNKAIIAVIYAEIVLLLMVLFGALLAFIRYWRRLFTPRSVLMLGFVGFFIGITLACGYARLRLSIEVFYLLAASYGIHEVWSCYKSHLFAGVKKEVDL